MEFDSFPTLVAQSFNDEGGFMNDFCTMDEIFLAEMESFIDTDTLESI